MATKERVYNIPLRKEWIKQSRIRRVPRSVNVVRSFLERHTKAEEVKLSTGVNEYLWIRGIKKAPSSIKVKVSLEDNIAFARLPEEAAPKKEDKKKSKEEKKEEKKDEKKDVKDKPAESPKEEPKVEDKPAEKIEEKAEETVEKRVDEKPEEKPVEKESPKEVTKEEAKETASKESKPAETKAK